MFPAPILSLACALLAGAAAPTAPEEPPPCRMYLVPCNLGEAYSGTFQWTFVVEGPAGKTTETVTARVVRGKTTCEGSVVSTDGSTQTGPIRGNGLLTVESGLGTDDDPAQPWYQIAVACPGVDGAAARMGGGETSTYKQPLWGLASLEGSHEEEHPDTDPVNGVSGTVRLRWSLSRSRP